MTLKKRMLKFCLYLCASLFVATLSAAPKLEIALVDVLFDGPPEVNRELDAERYNVYFRLPLEAGDIEATQIDLQLEDSGIEIWVGNSGQTLYSRPKLTVQLSDEAYTTLLKEINDSMDGLVEVHGRGEVIEGLRMVIAESGFITPNHRGFPGHYGNKQRTLLFLKGGLVYLSVQSPMLYHKNKDQFYLLHVQDGELTFYP